jgi:hypothetical protein
MYDYSSMLPFIGCFIYILPTSDLYNASAEEIRFFNSTSTNILELIASFKDCCKSVAEPWLNDYTRTVRKHM